MKSLCLDDPPGLTMLNKYNGLLVFYKMYSSITFLVLIWVYTKQAQKYFKKLASSNLKEKAEELLAIIKENHESKPSSR